MLNILLTAESVTAEITAAADSAVAEVTATAESTADAASSAASAVSSAATGLQGFLTGPWGTVILFAVLILAMYFIMIRPQKKKEKEAKMMRDALAVGDEIVTIGGISGTVVSIREDSVVIESGSDRDKMRIMKWAIQNITKMRDTSENEDSK